MSITRSAALPGLDQTPPRLSTLSILLALPHHDLPPEASHHKSLGHMSASRQPSGRFPTSSARHPPLALSRELTHLKRTVARFSRRNLTADPASPPTESDQTGLKRPRVRTYPKTMQALVPCSSEPATPSPSRLRPGQGKGRTLMTRRMQVSAFGLPARPRR